MNQVDNDKEIILYSTFFFFPFKIKKDNENDLFPSCMPLEVKGIGYWKEMPYYLWENIDGQEEWDKYSLHNQEILYFHRYLREVVFKLNLKKDKETVLKYYRLHDKDTQKEIIFGADNIISTCGEVKKGFYLSDVALYIFKDSKIGILSLEVTNNKGCTLEEALDFNKKFKLLYLSDN